MGLSLQIVSAGRGELVQIVGGLWRIVWGGMRRCSSVNWTTGPVPSQTGFNSQCPLQGLEMLHQN
jgi:hypothetical protein